VTRFGSLSQRRTLFEEMIENVIAEAVPNSGCFEVPKMQFWRKLQIIRALVIPTETWYWPFSLIGRRRRLNVRKRGLRGRVQASCVKPWAYSLPSLAGPAP